jgi:hypothetical protein
MEQSKINIKKILFYIALVPFLFFFCLYMAFYEIEMYFTWRHLKKRTYLNGVWSEE